jgi:hypothetical protein
MRPSLLISAGVVEEPAPPWHRGSLTRVAHARRRRSRSLTPLPFGCAGFGMLYREGEISKSDGSRGFTETVPPFASGAEGRSCRFLETP